MKTTSLKYLFLLVALLVLGVVITQQDAKGELLLKETTASKEFLGQITTLGGRTSPNPEPGKPLRVFIPPPQLDALAPCADVTAISVATLSTTGGTQLLPDAPTPKADT